MQLQVRRLSQQEILVQARRLSQQILSYIPWGHTRRDGKEVAHEGFFFVAPASLVFLSMFLRQQSSQEEILVQARRLSQQILSYRPSGHTRRDGKEVAHQGFLFVAPASLVGLSMFLRQQSTISPPSCVLGTQTSTPSSFWMQEVTFPFWITVTTSPRSSVMVDPRK